MEALRNLVDTILGRLRAIERAIAASHITRRAHRQLVNQLRNEVEFLSDQYDAMNHRLNDYTERVNDIKIYQDNQTFF